MNVLEKTVNEYSHRSEEFSYDAVNRTVAGPLSTAWKISARIPPQIVNGATPAEKRNYMSSSIGAET